jgi:hypothetical protein
LEERPCAAFAFSARAAGSARAKSFSSSPARRSARMRISAACRSGSKLPARRAYSSMAAALSIICPGKNSTVFPPAAAILSSAVITSNNRKV